MVSRALEQPTVTGWEKSDRGKYKHPAAGECGTAFGLKRYRLNYAAAKYLEYQLTMHNVASACIGLITTFPAEAIHREAVPNSQL
jgi:hypothetical protein